MECAACGQTNGVSKCYTVRKGGVSHLVCFCNSCYSALQKEVKNPTGGQKAGRTAKSVVGALGAIGLIVLTAIFSVALFALKSIMKTKSGAEENEGSPSFSFGEANFGDGMNSEPILEDFQSQELMGYEVSDETGQLHSTDDLVRELYGAEGTFNESDTTFVNPHQTFSDGED